ncbi:hypothetical protein NVS55_03900 [Myxococcus stipitatus]|uniref:hypothetical protein n=1 Tax=Myxococcus stipitatus TaxID=83455 RepID=UPI0031450076
MKAIRAGLSRMLPLVFSLLSFTPGFALANSEVPVPEGALPVEPRNASSQAPEPSSRSAVLSVLHTSARILVELGAMSATSLAVGAPGAYIGGVACSDHSAFIPCLDEALAGFFTGATVGAPIGIMWGARLLGGKGTWGGTLLGSGIGAGTGAVTALLLVNKGDEAVIPIAAFAGSFLGSFVGYEVSHSINSKPPDPADTHVQPLVSVTQGGMMMGLGGRF